jgi:TonB family protein
MRRETFQNFAPLEVESLLTRLKRELSDALGDFRADPRAFVQSIFWLDRYGRQRSKILWRAEMMSFLVLVMIFSAGAIIRLLSPTAVITARLDLKRVAYIDLSPPPLPRLEAPKQDERAGGGGGGGANEPNPPSFGRLPRATLETPLISPSPHPSKIQSPSLPVEPTIQAQPELLPQMSADLPLGDPSSRSMIPSAGPGSGGGIGTGRGGGVGPGKGTGYGPGEGWNVGGGQPRVGGGDESSRQRLAASRPQILNKPRPDWTEEARQARIQGQVVLSATFGADGAVRNIRLVRGLGYGLDEKAIEAARLLKFVPARDAQGRPMDYRLTIYVEFTLL